MLERSQVDLQLLYTLVQVVDCIGFENDAVLVGFSEH